MRDKLSSGGFVRASSGRAVNVKKKNKKKGAGSYEWTGDENWAAVSWAAVVTVVVRTVQGD